MDEYNQTSSPPSASQDPFFQPAPAPQPSPECIVTVRTKFDENAFRALNKFSSRTLKFVLPICSVALILCGALFTFTAQNNPIFISGGVAVMISGVLYTPIMLLMQGPLRRKAMRSTSILRMNMIQTFGFTADRMYRGTTSDGGPNESGEYGYRLFFMAHETATHFFLFISNTQAYVLPKTDFIQGTPSDLRALLAAKLGAKFKLYGKI